MRNLKVKSVIVFDTWLFNEGERREVQQSTLPSIDKIEAVCVDAENKIFCACDAGIYELSSKTPKLIDWTEQRNGAQLVSFDHLSDEYVLCAVLSSSLILIVDYENGNIEQCCIAPTEICAASWAPDYHVLLLASKDTLYFVTRQFDVLSKQPLNSTTVGREELVTVGWGSKETQFQGQGARRRPKEDDNGEPTAVNEYDHRRILLAWHGDSNYIAVSYVEEETSFRKFCVFDHEGELISRMVQIANVEETLAYRPTGNLIATSRLRGNQREIIFFERNGQRRSLFELGPHSGTVIDWLAWNNDGTIFCIVLKNLEGTVQEVQFWCCSNYDWMFKYCITATSGFLWTRWHEINCNQFSYITRMGRAVLIEFDFAYDFCDGIVMSIAGSHVRVTNLKEAPMPPPMCHYQLSFPAAVCEVAQFNSRAAFLLADHSLHAYIINDGKFEKSGVYDTTFLPKDCLCYNLCLNYTGQLSAIVASSSYALYILHLKKLDFEKSMCFYSSTSPFIWHSNTVDGFLLQTSDGQWFSLTKVEGKDSAEIRILTSTGSVLRHCRYLSVSDSIFGINKGNDLLMNGQLILRCVGSYTIDSNYLLAVKFSSQSSLWKLQVIKLEDILNAEKEISCGNERSVERGAMLVGHETNGYRVWLQMPRGNLETVYLRNFVLLKLKELLRTHHFKEAALLMKKHRIDMNLFYDNNPEFFMEHIGQFVDDINSADLLNLFVGSLTNDIINVTDYASSTNSHDVLKIHTICTALRKHILSLDEWRINELYTTVIYTYLKEEPPQISEALLALRERSSKLTNGGKLEEDWIAYLSLLAPKENLFKVALSTYDLSLAFVVARNSQMDPKEYLPLLEDFKSQSPLAYQKFRIDMYLGLFNRAIQNLSESDDHWDEAAEIIKRKNLYSEALVAYQGKKAYLKACELCANHLLDKRRFEEAALLFRRANNIKKALHCYQSAHNWKRFIECGQLLGMEKKELDDVLGKMMRDIESRGKFFDVAKILSFIDEKSNKIQILEYYCKADAWDIAVHSAYGNEELVAVVRENACIRCKQILLDAETWENLLKQYSSRLKVVRENKQKLLDTAIERCVVHDPSISDVFSEASTLMSDMSKLSATSTVSSRRRKHVEKMKKVLKEGSHYEDAALLNALKDVISLIDSRQDELILLLPALIAVDEVEEARTLQSCFTALLKNTHRIIEAAWPPYLSAHIIPGPLREIYRDENGAICFPEAKSMPAKIPLDVELIRPQMRNIHWQLEICK